MRVYPGAGLSVFMPVLCSYRSALLFHRPGSPPKEAGLDTPGESEPTRVRPQILHGKTCRTTGTSWKGGVN